MKTKLFAAILVSSLLVGILVGAVSIKPAAANPDAISINPSATNKIPSNLYSFFDVYVDVDIQDPEDLLAFDINITWNNNLIIFSSLDKSYLSTTIWPSQGYYEPLSETGGAYRTDVGTFRYAAVAQGLPGYTGTGHLFKLTFQIVKACNFELSCYIHFNIVKLSDHNAHEISVTKNDGLYTMSATTPDLEFVYSGPTQPLPYCKTFQIKVYVTHICATLEDYNLKILYDTSLLKLTGVDWTGGVLGGPSDGASYTESPAGTIEIVDTGGITYTGPPETPGLLFTLSFHVEFTGADPTHIWRTDNQGPLHTSISLNDASLSFVEGTITKNGINMPGDLSIDIKLIQGDVNCNGWVEVLDLRAIAAYYDKTKDDPNWNTIKKYNLKADDDIIDIFDLVLVATNFGYKDP
jgi:hypothetical protein